jgi:hypothetical protein
MEFITWTIGFGCVMCLMGYIKLRIERNSSKSNTI